MNDRAIVLHSFKILMANSSLKSSSCLLNEFGFESGSIMSKQAGAFMRLASLSISVRTVVGKSSTILV